MYSYIRPPALSPETVAAGANTNLIMGITYSYMVRCDELCARAA